MATAFIPVKEMCSIIHAHLKLPIRLALAEHFSSIIHMFKPVETQWVGGGGGFCKWMKGTCKWLAADAGVAQ